MVIIVQYNLELEQIDVQTKFLHRNLKKKIYMDQLEDFVVDKSNECLFE